MANRPNYKDVIKAYPTHILIPDNEGEKEQIMYANWNGDIFFPKGFQPERGKSYRLVVNEEYEAQFTRNKASK